MPKETATILTSNHRQSKVYSNSIPFVPTAYQDKKTSTKTLDDSSLVKMTLQGDTKAFEILCNRHTSSIANTVARILGRRSETEDIVQETFIKAFLLLKQLRDPSLFAPWVRKIAIRKTHQFCRKTQILTQLRIKEPKQEDLEFMKLASQEASAETLYELKIIQERVKTFPTKIRIAWVLHEVEGHTLEEVSDLTGYSLASTKRYISKARNMLQEVTQ